jgi:hypothetical protein
VNATVSEACTNQEIGLYQPYFFKQDKAPSYSWHITSHGNAEREQKSEVFQGIFKNVLLAPFMGRGLSAFADN